MGSKDAGQLAEQVVQRTAASATTSPTQAGQSDQSAEDRAQRIEALNQVFALFRLNFNNQFYAAFPDSEQLNQVKRLWLDTLAEFPPEVLLRGAKVAIEQSEYLPTLHRMIESCQRGLSDFGLPSPRDAYLEACNATSPKQDFSWSHPAIYLAGRDSDWFFLANNTENLTWPVFREHYQKYVKRALGGEQFVIPERKALEQQPSTPMDTEARKAALKELRAKTSL